MRLLKREETRQRRQFACNKRDGANTRQNVGRRTMRVQNRRGVRVGGDGGERGGCNCRAAARGTRGWGRRNERRDGEGSREQKKGRRQLVEVVHSHPLHGTSAPFYTFTVPLFLFPLLIPTVDPIVALLVPQSLSPHSLAYSHAIRSDINTAHG
jgi:hypothetical protein